MFNTNKLLAILRFDGGHIGFKFGLPVSVITVWQFVSVPNSGVNVNTGLPIEFLPVAIVTVPALLVVQAVLTAGYFGSIRNSLYGELYAFVLNCKRHFIPFLIITSLPTLLLLPLAAGIIGTSAVTGGFGGTTFVILLVALVGFVILGYLFYPVPYLIVLHQTGVVDAAQRSYALATQGGPYVSYTAGFALFVLGISPIATALVLNIPVIGLALGIIGGGILGLAANIMTMRFIADIASKSLPGLTWDTTTDTDLQ
ncbi:hypothetical protein [Halobellus marinus]|uniref:hypothetical protein n=1 Tax=Halobellus TaxID=1073986 RepID=UPI0028ADD545|nr:hypothetical protein [Halobellus sp. DFY28]